MDSPSRISLSEQNQVVLLLWEASAAFEAAGDIPRAVHCLNSVCNGRFLPTHEVKTRLKLALLLKSIGFTKTAIDSLEGAVRGTFSFYFHSHLWQRMLLTSNAADIGLRCHVLARLGDLHVHINDLTSAEKILRAGLDLFSSLYVQSAVFRLLIAVS